ncbi:MAG: hypothetical protein OEV49_12130 [candidate division Zixibacteria bacterium]|nr:hypothetical protein [candidate division Zixibacteria bacterium]MDH3937308.1 hypothetical protein [candidate division Zixibacteria bacterium]MDH4034885.1 hypothetical protein [candidate division Zixibacteria bacterium]
MAKKKEATPYTEEHEVEGHAVQIRKEGDVERLLVDGIPRRFFMRGGGYVLYDNAYATPQKTLLAAVKEQLQGTTDKSGSN